MFRRAAQRGRIFHRCGSGFRLILCRIPCRKLFEEFILAMPILATLGRGPGCVGIKQNIVPSKIERPAHVVAVSDAV
jgi:hypothetical protein